MKAALPRRVIGRCAVLLTGTLLVACQQTWIETLPDGATATCPKDLPGGYVGIDADTGEDAPFGVHVARDCAVLVIDREKSLDADPVAIAPRYLVEDAKTVALLSGSDVRKVEKRDSSGHDAHWLPFAIERRGRDLALYAPDHRRIATLIVHGALPGRTEWSGESGTNLVAGDAAALRERLLRDGWFTGMRVDFRRVSDSRRELERVIQRAHYAERRKESK